MLHIILKYAKSLIVADLPSISKQFMYGMNG